MAKMNKIMPPRNTTIRGSDHLLAYITPEEADLLKARGGSGEPGPMGIPAFRPGGDDVGSENAGSGDHSGGAGSASGANSGGSSGNTSNDSGSDSTYDKMSQSEIDAAIKNALTDNPYTLADNVSEYGIATDDFGSNLFGGDYYPEGTEYGQPNYKAVTDVWNQINKAKQYEQPIEATIMSLFNPFASIEKVQSLASQFMGPRYINALSVVGNTPISKNGRVTGVKDKYGNVIEGSDFDKDYGGRDGGPEDVKPVNPETGQCDEGYMFDEDMQACRLDTGYQTAASTVGGAFDAPGDQYARMGLLDQAPTGLPQFQQQYGAGFGTPSQFADANMAFRRRGAYEPANFQRPYPTTGYTLLS